MIPILYSHDETQFTSNGVGRLSECLTCTVTEEVNGIYECEFTYPITGKYFNDLINGPDGANLGIIAVTHDHNGDVQPFDIYKFSAPINGIVTFNARHISYRLINQIVGYADGESVTNTSYLFTSVLSGPGTVVFPTGQHFSFVDHANYTASEGHSMSWRGAVSARQLMFSGYRTGEEYGTESIINSFPGEFKWDKFTGHYYRSRGSYNGVQIRYGKNLLDINREKDTSGIVNAIFPFWISKDDPSVFRNGTLQVSPHAGSDVRAASLDLSDEFDTQPTAAQLNAQALLYMSKNSTWRGQENITVNTVDLYDTNPGFEKITLGDYVDVIYTDLGVVAEQVEVISVTFDALAERFTEIQCGQFPTTYAEVITGMVPSGGSSGGGSSITVDDALSSISTNPVQNRVINAALNAIQEHDIIGTASTEQIPSNSDLNNYFTPGVWRVLSAAVANTIINYPSVKIGGKIITILLSDPPSVGGYMLQMALLNGGRMFARYKAGATATPTAWKEFTMQGEITAESISAVSYASQSLTSAQENQVLSNLGLTSDLKAAASVSAANFFSTNPLSSATYDIRKSGKVVSFYAYFASAPSSGTIKSGYRPCGGTSGHYMILPLLSKSSPYTPVGSVWINGSGAMTFYGAGSGGYVSGTWVCT